MKTQKEDLSNIYYLEAKEANWGAKAARARNEYVEKYSEFKHNDRLILTLSDNTEKFGVVNHISFNTHEGFKYQIKPRSKNWDNKVNRKAFYYYTTIEGFSVEVRKIRRAI